MKIRDGSQQRYETANLPRSQAPEQIAPLERALLRGRGQPRPRRRGRRGTLQRTAATATLPILEPAGAAAGLSAGRKQLARPQPPRPEPTRSKPGGPVGPGPNPTGPEPARARAGPGRSANSGSSQAGGHKNRNNPTFPAPSKRPQQEHAQPAAPSRRRPDRQAVPRKHQRNGPQTARGGHS